MRKKISLLLCFVLCLGLVAMGDVSSFAKNISLDKKSVIASGHGLGDKGVTHKVEKTANKKQKTISKEIKSKLAAGEGEKGDYPVITLGQEYTKDSDDKEVILEFTPEESGLYHLNSSNPEATRFYFDDAPYQWDEWISVWLEKGQTYKIYFGNYNDNFDGEYTISVAKTQSEELTCGNVAEIDTKVSKIWYNATEILVHINYDTPGIYRYGFTLGEGSVCTDYQIFEKIEGGIKPIAPYTHNEEDGTLSREFIRFEESKDYYLLIDNFDKTLEEDTTYVGEMDFDQVEITGFEKLGTPRMAYDGAEKGVLVNLKITYGDGSNDYTDMLATVDKDDFGQPLAITYLGKAHKGKYYEVGPQKARYTFLNTFSLDADIIVDSYGELLGNVCRTASANTGYETGETDEYNELFLFTPQETGYYWINYDDEEYSDLQRIDDWGWDFYDEYKEQAPYDEERGSCYLEAGRTYVFMFEVYDKNKFNVLFWIEKQENPVANPTPSPVTPKPTPKSKSKLNTPKIKSIKNNSPKSIKVTWNKITGAKGYEVLYSKNKSLKQAKTKRVTKNSVKLKGLKKKTYYVKVCAYTVDKKGNKIRSNYSKVQKVKVKK